MSSYIAAEVLQELSEVQQQLDEQLAEVTASHNDARQADSDAVSSALAGLEEQVAALEGALAEAQAQQSSDRDGTGSAVAELAAKFDEARCNHLTIHVYWRAAACGMSLGLGPHHLQFIRARLCSGAGLMPLRCLQSDGCS